MSLCGNVVVVVVIAVDNFFEVGQVFSSPPVGCGGAGLMRFAMIFAKTAETPLANFFNVE